MKVFKLLRLNSDHYHWRLSNEIIVTSINKQRGTFAFNSNTKYNIKIIQKNNDYTLL